MKNRVYFLVIGVFLSIGIPAQDNNNYNYFISSPEIFIKSELNFFQRRLQNSFKKEKYQKCIRQASTRISHGKLDKVAYYYMALSTFKIYENKLNEFLFDKSLKHLKASQINSDPVVMRLKLEDQLLLEFIHQVALDLSERDVKKNRSRSLRRLKYVAEIFKDTSNLYRELAAEKKLEYVNNVKIITSKKKEIKYNEASNELKSVAQLVKEHLEEQLNSRINQQKLSAYLTNELGVKIDIHQAKIIDVSASQYGVKEYEGRSHNPSVLKYFKETGHSHIKNDETSWCAAYMNWCAKKAALPYSKSLLARSWLKLGKKIEVPQVGDIVVFWRGSKSSWEGHVSLFLYMDKPNNQIYCLGGNQDDGVCVAPYPIDQILGYRRIKPN